MKTIEKIRVILTFIIMLTSLIMTALIIFGFFTGDGPKGDAKFMDASHIILFAS